MPSKPLKRIMIENTPFITRKLGLGVAGLVLPVLQGWLFLAMGVIVLSRDVPLFARMEDRITARFPRARRLVNRLRAAFPLLAD
jgi:hypothetical protein